MDVGRIGQGRQINSEYVNKSERISNSGNNSEVSEIKTVSEVKENGQDNPSKEEILKAVDKINKFLEDEKVHAEYEVHEKLNDIMIKIVSDDTNEIILEIPPKKILDMVAKMLENVGILVDEKA